MKSETHIKFWLKNTKGRDHLGELGLDNRIILKLIFKKGASIQVVQDTVHWWTFVNTVMYILVP
jgi:hypothetical protein